MAHDPPASPTSSPPPAGAVAGGERPDEVRLSQNLSLLDVTLLGVGALLGGGIFVVTGIAAGVAGPAVLFAFLLNAIITLPTLMIYAELGSAYHDAGGGYLWVKDGLGRMWGFLGGWMGWFSHAVACAVYALAAAAYTVWVLNASGVHIPALIGGEHGAIKLIATAVVLAFVYLNYVGVHQSAKLENTITLLVIAAVLAFIGFGLYTLYANPGRAAVNFSDTFPRGAEGLFLATGLTFIAFVGYEVISQASEEVKNSKYNIPKAIWASLLIVLPLYLLVVVVAVGAVVAPGGGPSWSFLGTFGETAIVEASNQIMPAGGLVIVGVALLMQLTALNATIYSSSRVSFAMGRDRSIPEVFAKVHPRRRTPHVSVFASGAIIIGMAVLLPIESVAAAAEIMFLLLFSLVNVSAIKLRKTTKHLDFGYRAKGFPVLPLLGLAGNLFLVYYLFRYSPVSFLSAAAWIGVGGLTYFLYARRYSSPTETPVAPEPQVVFQARGLAGRKAYRVLVPVANPATVDALLKVARPLAKANDGEIVLLSIVTVPAATLPSAGQEFYKEAIPILERARQAAGDVPTHTIVKIGHNVADAILETIDEEEADVAVLGWRGHTRAKEFVFGSTLDPILRRASCSLVMIRLTGSARFERVLVPTRLGKQAPLALTVGKTLADAAQGEVDVLHIITPESTEDVPASLREPLIRRVVREHLPGAEPRLLLRESEDVVGTVVAESAEHDTVVVGASGKPAWRIYLLGDPVEQIAKRAEGTVIVVKEAGLLRRQVLYRLVDRLTEWMGYLRRDTEVAERSTFLPHGPRRRGRERRGGQ